MSKFLNTTATNYLLEKLIKSAQERLILISPFLGEKRGQIYFSSAIWWRNGFLEKEK